MLTQHDETEQAQLGLGIVQALANMDADQTQNDVVRAYNEGNMRLWQRRSGLATEGISESGPGSKKKMGHTVRIGSPEYHLGGIAAAIIAAALLLAIGGLGVAWILKGEPAKTVAPAVNNDTDTRSTLRPYSAPLERRQSAK